MGEFLQVIYAILIGNRRTPISLKRFNQIKQYAHTVFEVKSDLGKLTSGSCRSDGNQRIL